MRRLSPKDGQLETSSTLRKKELSELFPQRFLRSCSRLLCSRLYKKCTARVGLCRIIPLIIVVIVFVEGCNVFSPKPLSLLCTVKVNDTSEQTFDVELVLKDAPKGVIRLRTYLYKKDTRIVKFAASDHSGIEIRVQHLEAEESPGNRRTYLVKAINNPREGQVTVCYTVQVGTNYARHGMQPFGTHGYMCDRFALVSGKNLFLLPENPIGSMQVRFVLPDNWQASVPWQKSGDSYVPVISPEYLREELVNTTLAFGLLEHRMRRIGETQVHVYLYKDWKQATKKHIYRNAFSNYAMVQEIFGGDGKGKYNFNFVPKTDDGLAIISPSWSSSQGNDMAPATQERWLFSTEKLIKRWIKYPPFRMMYSSSDDYWLVDGIGRYYAIRVGGQLGWLDEDLYLKSERRKLLPNLADVKMYHPRSHPIKNTTDPKDNDVRELYRNDGWQLRKKRRAIAPSIVYYLDDGIHRNTHGKHRLIDVLRYQYKKRVGLDLLTDVAAVAGKNTSEFIASYLHNLKEITTKFDVVNRRPEVPRFRRAEIKPENTDTLRIVFTGRTRGFLEHCGCKSNQHGGIARRATVISAIRNQFPDILVADIGNSFAYDPSKYRLSSLDVRELDVYLQSMDSIGYDLAVISHHELYYGYEFFRTRTSSVSFPFVCANVLKDGVPISKPYVSVSIGSFQVAFLGIFQHPVSMIKEVSYVFQDRTADLSYLDPIVAIEKYLPELRANNDLVFVVGNLETGLIRDRVVPLTAIDGVISIQPRNTHLSETPLGLTLYGALLSGFQGNTLVVFERTQLYGINMMELWIDKREGIVGGSLKSLPLGDDVDDDIHIRDRLDDLYRSVIRVDIEPLMGWNQRFSDAEFVGVRECRTCHQTQYAQWKTTSHATAFNTLLDARRHFQPNCVQCHVTGLGDNSGYKLGALKSPMLHVQCEMCHGPGGNHIRNPMNAKMIRKPSTQICTTCHDKDHSDFNLSTYYPRVTH